MINDFHCFILYSGRPSYLHAMKRTKGETIESSYFMTYHIPLQHSKDFTRALQNARIISESITDAIRELIMQTNSEETDVEVFPYSFFYVFYEQYLTIWSESLKNIVKNNKNNQTKTHKIRGSRQMKTSNKIIK